MGKMVEACTGFIDLGGPNGTISQVMESMYLNESIDPAAEGAVRLLVAGQRYTDDALKEMAEETPQGQHLWAFSPHHRNIRHYKMTITHVPAPNNREFVLKVGRHVERFLREQPVGSRFKPARPDYPPATKHYYSTKSYFPDMDERHLVRVHERDVTFDLMSDLRQGARKLVVFGQDALTRSKVELPKFFRWSWGENLDASVLVLNDPTLYIDDKLDAGWWVGTRDRDFIHEGVAIVKRAAEANGIETKDVLFVGVSAGGFSSLHMAAALPGSRALVDIPQIDLRTYAQMGHANAAVRAGLGFQTVADVPAEYLHRVDVIERFEHEDNVPDFSYFQNLRDHTHVDSQLGRFKEKLGSRITSSSRFETYSATHLVKGGHFPMSQKRLLDEIRADLRISEPAKMPQPT